MRTNFLKIFILFMSVVFIYSCDDEQYQKYEKVAFDESLAGKWATKSEFGLKTYTPIFLINKNQEGYYYTLKVEKLENDKQNFYIGTDKVVYNLTKDGYLIAQRVGENPAFNFGTFAQNNSDSIVVTNPKLVEGKTVDFPTVYYSIEYLEEKGYELSTTYEVREPEN